jgi:predicted nuclease of predicted toxin-antitoxin system
LTRTLRAAGFEAKDVRDVGLRGHSDQEVFEAAQSRRLILLTADLDFSNTLRFPLGQHHGIFVARFPNDISSETLNRAILNAAQDLAAEDVRGAIVIIEPGRLRLRRRETEP